MEKLKKCILLLSIFSSVLYAKDIDLKKEAKRQEIVNIQRMYKDDIYKIYVSPLKQTVITFGSEIVEYSETGNNIAFHTIDDTNNVRIKPVDENTETDLVVKTNEDLYYFKVFSQYGMHNPMINFLYPQKEYTKKQRINQREEQVAKASLSELNFNYRISRKKSWTPTQIFDDGIKTFFYMPKKIQEVPALLIKDDDGTLSTVTFRIDETENGTKYYVIDRLFKEGVLILGKTKVFIKNKGYKY